MRLGLSVFLLWTTAAARAQSVPDLKAILDRLDRLERENQELRQEVRELRTLVAVPPAPVPELPERVEVLESRVEEHAQTKVETSQKFPLHVTGMALFNMFHNGPRSNGLDVPLTAAVDPSNRVAGATFRQSILGLEFHGPKTVLGGTVKGSLIMDFFNGTSEPVYNPLRIRIADITLDWKSRSIAVGYEKAIFNPREPTSLMMVGITPLSGAGNLWRWQPQVRFEQRARLSESTSLTATVGILQTSEEYGGNYPNLEIERRRPGIEGRFELSRRLDETRRIEIAPGFHASTSHIAEVSIPSRLFSLDWFMNPWRRLEFSGAFYYGENVAHLGGLRQGYLYVAYGRVTPVHATGGWGQLTFNATSRLAFHLMSGQQDDRNSDLLGSGIAKNLAAGGNAMYHLAPNVILSFEALRTRTTWIASGNKINDRYDLALAYLF